MLPLLLTDIHAGNYAGEYDKNVLAPKDQPTADWNTGSEVTS
jgi:hypothetical protein